MVPTQVLFKGVALGLVAAMGALSQVAMTAADGPTRIRYIQNSGWLVLTPSHALLFDVVQSIGGGADLPDELLPNLDEYVPRVPVVFVSHGHSDHYSAATLAAILRTHPSAIVVSGGPIAHGSARVMRPREVWSVEGLTIRTTDSTDEGVGFVVSVDGMTIFHAGDLAVWDDDSRAPFEAEISWVREQAPVVDIAFLPVATGASCEPRPLIWEGALSAAASLRPRVLFPMHVRCRDKLGIYGRFRQEAEQRLDAVHVFAASEPGEWFTYESGTSRQDKPAGRNAAAHGEPLAESVGRERVRGNGK